MPLCRLGVRTIQRQRIAAFSTGNVYGLSPVERGGAIESTVAPVGEYALSCLGRERIFEHFSRTFRSSIHYPAQLRS